jgi:hypothetical protein
VLLLKLRNNSALHSKMSSAVMILFVGRKPTLLKYEGQSYQGLLTHDPDLSMTQIGHRSWSLSVRTEQIVQRVATNVAIEQNPRPCHLRAPHS